MFRKVTLIILAKIFPVQNAAARHCYPFKVKPFSAGKSKSLLAGYIIPY